MKQDKKNKKQEEIHSSFSIKNIEKASETINKAGGLFANCSAFNFSAFFCFLNSLLDCAFKDPEIKKKNSKQIEIILFI